MESLVLEPCRGVVRAAGSVMNIYVSVRSAGVACCMVWGLPNTACYTLCFEGLSVVQYRDRLLTVCQAKTVQVNTW